MIKKFRCQHSTHQVARLRWSRAAATVAIETGERLGAAGLQFGTEDILFTIHSLSLAWGAAKCFARVNVCCDDRPGER